MDVPARRCPVQHRTLGAMKRSVPHCSNQMSDFVHNGRDRESLFRMARAYDGHEQDDQLRLFLRHISMLAAVFALVNVGAGAWLGNLRLGLAGTFIGLFFLLTLVLIRVPAFFPPEARAAILGYG